jgi:hypothetical protein
MVVGNYGDSSMETGTVIFKGDLDENINGGKQFDFGSGNIVFDTSETGTGPMVFVGAGQNLPQTLLTEGAQTISNYIENQGASNAIIGGSDASNSTFSGYINAGGGGGELDLRAAAGGTVTFSGQIDGDDSATTKDGDGTVILSHATGNTWTSYSNTLFEMKAGTTLIENTSGDAFGNGGRGTTGPVFVQLDTGAKLGGTGSTQQALVAQAGSEISPGLAGKIGTLTLGGLTATGGVTPQTGVTFDFKLAPSTGDRSANQGIDNDYISTGNGLSLTGNININISTFASGLAEPPTPETPYLLMSGTGLWSGAPIFNFNLPVGYELDSSYGTDGYFFDTINDNFSVEFAETPEPSTYALLGLGLLALAGIGRWLRSGRAI